MYPKNGQAIRLTYHGGRNVIADGPLAVGTFEVEGVVVETPAEGSNYVTIRPLPGQRYGFNRDRVALSGDATWTDGFDLERFSVSPQHMTVHVNPFWVYWSWVVLPGGDDNEYQARLNKAAQVREALVRAGVRGIVSAGTPSGGVSLTVSGDALDALVAALNLPASA